MSDALRVHLRERLGASFRQLERALAGVDESEAFAGADPHWPRERWGVGLDGSIAGIVWHVAAWKEVATTGLEGGVFPAAGDVRPAAPDWSGRREWLRESHARLAGVLERLESAALSRGITLEGEEVTLALLFTHMMEHDQYHAGQVNLLRQLRCPG
jgi:hypothetical protein